MTKPSLKQLSFSIGYQVTLEMLFSLPIILVPYTKFILDHTINSLCNSRFKQLTKLKLPVYHLEYKIYCFRKRAIYISTSLLQISTPSVTKAFLFLSKVFPFFLLSRIKCYSYFKQSKTFLTGWARGNGGNIFTKSSQIH